MDEPEFSIEDLPEHLRPSSLLVEVFEQLSGLKDSIISTKEKENELQKCIKQLESKDKIYSCSYTLETIVQQLNSSLNNEDILKEKIGKQSKSIFHLK